MQNYFKQLKNIYYCWKDEAKMANWEIQRADISKKTRVISTLNSRDSAMKVTR